MRLARQTWVNRNGLTLLASAALAVWMGGMLTGCKPDQESSHAIVILFDVSGSTIEIRKRYQRDFEEKVLGELQGGEVLTVGLITGNTIAQWDPIEKKFPQFDLKKDNLLVHKQNMQKLKEDAKPKVKELLQRTSTQTDLLNAFVAAGKVFNGEGCKGVPDKILVVFSDMVEQSSSYDFMRIKLTEQLIKQIIETLRKEGKLPNLQGVKVWVAGATAAEQGGLHPNKIYEIEKFWIEYFKACGANLTPQRYATTLADFKLER